MRLKLAALYLMLALTMMISIYAVIQCIPEPQEPEEPYEYENMVPPAAVITPDPAPVPESSEQDVPLEDEIPQVVPPVVFLPDHNALHTQNKDYIGWLQIDGTDINLPVVQGKDNSYYLKHTFSKKYSSYGCPFLDTRTPPGSDCLVIHGHNMGYNRTEVFSSLVYFEDPQYAQEHSVLRFLQPDGEGDLYTLFAVLNVDIKDPASNYIISSFETEDDRLQFLSKLQSESLYPSDDIPSSGQILILSTCNRRYGEDNRLLIVALQNVEF